MLRRVVGRGCGFLLAVTTSCTLVNDYPAVRDASSASEFRNALSSSEPGDYVRLIGDIEGMFEVPAGVIVLGTESGSLTVPSEGIGLDLRSSLDPTTPTTVQDLRMVARGRAGVRAVGGHVRLENLQVDTVEPSVAVYLEDLESAELSALQLAGDQARDLFLTEFVSTGLVLRRVAEASLTDIEARYFGQASVALVESTVRWDRGRASEGGRFGLLVHSSSVTIADVDASGLRGLAPEAGILVSGDSDVRLRRVSASLGGSHGLVQLGGQCRMTAFQARGNAGIGIVVQDASTAELEVLVERNFAVGLLAVDVTQLRVADSEFRQHARSELATGTITIPFGDGIEIVRSFSDLRIERTSIDTSARVGLLLVAQGERLRGEMFEDLRISGFNDQFGAIQQGGTIDADWDRGILRSPSILANDMGPPPQLPSLQRFPEDIASLSVSIETTGLDALSPP